jgi:spectinomycin phosphotransferase
LADGYTTRMATRPTLPNAQLINFIEHEYGIHVNDLARLAFGADVNASVYRAESRDSTYFVKLKRGHEHDTAVAVTRYLYDQGIEEVIPPILTKGGAPAPRLGEHTLIVCPFVECKNGSGRALSDEQWVELGRTFWRVHDLDVPAELGDRIRREQYSPKWREAVRRLYEQLPAGVDEAGRRMAAMFREREETIRQMIARAEALVPPDKQGGAFVLCHSDIHANNVLTSDDGRLYAVDWDEPILAPRERDLMFIGAGVGHIWNEPREVELFYEGYGDYSVNRDLIRYYRTERIIEDLAQYGHDLMLTQDGPVEARMRAAVGTGRMFEPGGVVSQAMLELSR